jgi:twitching motility protein PilT
MIPHQTPQLHQLGVPPSVTELAALPRGLVLVTGPTGSGKSTTLAAMIDKINRERHEHIVTVEDPIEFVHEHKGCVVNQREVFADTTSFGQALKHVLRQDPDIVLIGEMRDLETIEAALVVAETGHLVFSTLHTNCAVQTINRVIDVFPPHQQAQVRAQLSLVLQGVISQQLIPRRDGRGRAMACEVMIPNAAIRNLMREEKIHQIYSQMQVGQTKFGMQTMSQSLVNLVQKNVITTEEAMGHATEAEEMRQMLGIGGPAKLGKTG